MKLNRWSLDQLVAWGGTFAMLVLFVPLGLYLARDVASSAERSLTERGQSLAKTLAGQIVDHTLFGDRLALHNALKRAASTDAEVRYICVESGHGEVIAHTFTGGFPTALVKLWEKNRGRVVHFHTRDNPIMDIPAQIIADQSATLHVGMSRSKAVRATHSLMWHIGAALAGAFLIVMIAARVVAERISSPLQKLELQVSRFPQKNSAGDVVDVQGTSEVESLAKGFAKMTRRLKLLEQEKSMAQERMINAERLAALGELAAGLVHEIRNPLDGMMECVRYLEAGPNKRERIEKYLPMLNEGLGRIAGVMKHMLTFARLGRETSVEECLVAEVFDSIASMLQKQLANRKVHLAWHKVGNCVCLCNRHGLLQAILNLVLNAAEEAEKSVNSRVLIEAKCNAKQVFITVDDSGAGVPQELRDKIFAPFFTTKPIGKGTGLGLSTSRQLIRAVGGELELSRQPSPLGGARFTIRLPKVSTSELSR